VVAVGEGAQAASDQGHSAEAGAGLAGCVGAGGVLLAVLAITRSLQPMVCTCKGHLHGCWQMPLEQLQDVQVFVCVLKVLKSLFSAPGTCFVLSLLFLCEVESQWSRPGLPGAAESHMEITGNSDGRVRLFSFLRKNNLKLRLRQDWT